MIWENTLSGMVDSTASRFDESTQYKKSDYVWYAATGVKPKLYKAKEDMAAEAWDANKWEEISVSTEFANKESLITKNKVLNGKVEFDGNDLTIRRGKCYKFYTTDINKTYHAGDFICGYKPAEDMIDFIDPALIKSGFAPYDEDDPDREYNFDSLIYYPEAILETDLDTGELIPNPHGDFSQVPEGFLETHWDDDAGEYVPYKIHQDGTFEKLSADIKVSALTAAEFQAKGYSINDFVFADGNLIPGGEDWNPTTGIQYVEPSPEKTSIMDLAMIQDEIAPTWEAMTDKHYGSLFYHNYELYALVGIDQEYHEQIAFRDTTRVPNLVNLPDLGEYVWASKISNLGDLLQLGSPRCGYACSHGLIFNLFSNESTLRVLPTEDDCIKINGGLGIGNNYGIVHVNNLEYFETKNVIIDWDLRGEEAGIGFEFNKDETWSHEPLIDTLNVRNGRFVVYYDNPADIEADFDPYYCVCYEFNATNATVEIMSNCTSVVIGNSSNTFKNSKLLYYCYRTSQSADVRKCYVKRTTLEDSRMEISITGNPYITTQSYEHIDCSDIKANNSTIIFFNIWYFDGLSGDFTNCNIKFYLWGNTEEMFKNLSIIDGSIYYCNIEIEDQGPSTSNVPYLKDKQIVNDGRSSYNRVDIHYDLTDDCIPIMYAYPSSRAWHVGNSIFTRNGKLKWHDFPTA